MVASVLNWLGNFFQNLTYSMLNFLSNLFTGLFQGLIEVLKFLFNPVLIVIAALFYFIYKLAELIYTLLLVLLAIGKLLYSFVMGLFRTLAGISWAPQGPPDHGSWSGPISEVFRALELYQLDKVAYVLLFVIWIMTAWAAIRILSNKGGGDDD